MKTICINCPMGCMLDVEKVGEEIIVKGYTCARGLAYGKEEITAPKRVVTSLVKTKNYLYSVKTVNPVAKEKIFDVLNEIAKIQTDKNYEIGDIMVTNILNTGSNLIVTGKNAI